MKTMRGYNENYKHPCAGAQKSKLSKPKETMKTMMKTINILALARRNLNYLNHKRGYLSTMETIRFNNKNNERQQ